MKCPLAVALAEAERFAYRSRVQRAHAIAFDNVRQRRAGRRLGKMNEAHVRLSTQPIEDLDVEQRHARALIAKGNVEAVLRHRHATHFHVDRQIVRIGQRRLSAVAVRRKTVAGDDVHELVR